MLTNAQPLPEDDRSDLEIELAERDQRERDLREQLAFARAARATYWAALDRLVDAVEADDVTPRVLAQAQKALGRSYDAEDAGDIDNAGAF